MRSGNALKVGIAVVWLACASAFLLPATAALAGPGRRLFWVLLVVHGVECAVFLPRLRRAPGPLGGHLAQTLLFGIVHVRSLGAPSA